MFCSRWSGLYQQDVQSVQTDRGQVRPGRHDGLAGGHLRQPGHGGLSLPGVFPRTSACLAGQGMF